MCLTQALIQAATVCEEGGPSPRTFLNSLSFGVEPPVKDKYLRTIRTGHSNRSSESLPENGSKAGMKNGAGSSPGTEVFAKNPGTTLIDMPLAVKMRSRGSLEIACNSLRLFVDAKASRNTVFHVHLWRSCLVDQQGGSKSSDLNTLRTRDRSHSGTRGLSTRCVEENAFINLDKHGCKERGIPSTSPKAEAIEDL